MITREDITYQFHKVETYPYVNVTLEVQWKNFLDPLQMEKLTSKNPLRKLDQEIERLAEIGRTAIMEKIYGDIRTDILNLRYLVMNSIESNHGEVDSKFNNILRKVLGKAEGKEEDER